MDKSLETAQKFAQQVGQHRLFVGVEGADQVRFVGQVGGGDGVDQRATFVGEGDQRAAAIVRVGLAADQPLALELVQALGGPARGQHARVREVGRAQPV